MALLNPEFLFYIVLFLSYGFFVVVQGVRIFQYVMSKEVRPFAGMRAVWSLIPLLVLMSLAFIQWRRVTFESVSVMTGVHFEALKQ